MVNYEAYIWILVGIIKLSNKLLVICGAILY